MFPTTYCPPDGVASVRVCAPALGHNHQPERRANAAGAEGRRSTPIYPARLLLTPREWFIVFARTLAIGHGRTKTEGEACGKDGSQAMGTHYPPPLTANPDGSTSIRCAPAIGHGQRPERGANAARAEGRRWPP